MCTTSPILTPSNNSFPPAALHAYHRNNGELPQKILIYRDGVGDGQIKAVKEYELSQFTAACKVLILEIGRLIDMPLSINLIDWYCRI